jgi:hypothetical protein
MRMGLSEVLGEVEEESKGRIDTDDKMAGQDESTWGKGAPPRRRASPE